MRAQRKFPETSASVPPFVLCFASDPPANPTARAVLTPPRVGCRAQIIFSRLQREYNAPRCDDEMQPLPSPALVGRRRDTDLVEARGVHGIDLTHQNVGRHLVVG